MLSESTAFPFPSGQFKLIAGDTIGYISDNIFYQVDLLTGKSTAQHHPQGRSYQAFTANHKRGLTVIADYGKTSSLQFKYENHQKCFKVANICPLQIKYLSLSTDAKYLAIANGQPSEKLFIFNIEERKLIRGKQSFIDLKKAQDLKRVDFNPANRNILSLTFETKVEIYEIKDCFEVEQSGEVQNTILIKKNQTIESKEGKIECVCWDELNNLYLTNGRTLWLHSYDLNSEACSYDIEIDTQCSTVVSELLITPKHIIAFYTNGKIEFLIKYYPELLDQDSEAKPFQVDKYYQYENQRAIMGACYNHFYTHLIVAHFDGHFSVLEIEAERKSGEDEDEQNQKELEAQKTTKIEATVTIFGPFHTKPIILIQQIPQSSLCLTVSQDGRIILWSIKQKRQLQYFDTNQAIHSAAINSKCDILAIGLSNGVLKFFTLNPFESIFLFKEFRMTKGTPIDQVAFSSNDDELALLSISENRVYYLLTKKDLQLEVLGFISLAHTPVSLHWHSSQFKCNIKPKFEYLLVGIGYGVLMINSPNPTPTNKKINELNLECETYALRTDLDQKYVSSLPSGQVITTGEDRMIKKYKHPDELIAKVDFKTKFAIPEEIQAHDLAVSSWFCGPKGFVSGGEDGTVQIRSFDSFSTHKQFRAHGWKSSSLASVKGSSVKGYVFTGSKEGTFQIFKLDSTEQLPSNDTPAQNSLEYKKLKSLSSDLKYFEVVIAEEYLQIMKDAITKKKKIQFEKLNKIRVDLTQLLNENEQHDELERLSRDEFAIDLETRQKVQEVGKAKCLQIREDSKKSILANEVLAKKLKQITWDRMSIHLKAINGIKNNFIVYNYQIRKINKQEKRKIQLVMDLRRNQKREAKKLGNSPFVDPDFYKNKNVVNGGIILPLILTSYEKKDEKKEEKGKKKKQEQVVKKEEEVEEIFNEEEWSLLYSSFELFSNNAKKNQIILMQHLIIRIKQNFNKQFEKLMKFRQNQNQMINDKNKRIVEICQELKRSNEVIIGKKNILESNDDILEVQPDQISFKRYLSKEERQKLEKQRVKEEERLRKLAEDDSSHRALQKMMGGTLAEKKTSVLEMGVEKQKWMEKPFEEMSEEERSKYKEYEQKSKKAEQEKERIVKKLEAQLRKLKQQIDDIMEKYDQKLFILLKRKIEYDYRIQEQELYTTRLYLSIVDCHQQSKRSDTIRQRIDKSGKNLEILSHQKQIIRDHEMEIEKAKQNKRASIDMKKLGDIQSKIKTIEKTVFEEYNQNIKKRREMQQKLLELQPQYQKQLIHLDPLRDVESKNLSQQKAKDFNFFATQIKILQQNYDIPEGSLIQILESRFKIRKEEAQLQQKIKALRETLCILEEQQRIGGQEKQAFVEELQEIELFLERQKSDLEVQIRIKQGQLQINNQTPVPDLDNALLISKEEIDEKNVAIKSNAKHKIEVMTEIKTCKISVTQQTLNIEKKEELINKLSLMIKEIQMLKVKKEMQVALSKKDSKMNENEMKSLKEQIEKVRKEGQKRINLFQKKIQKIGKQIESLRKENKQLEVQKWNLDATVKQRQKIKDSMVGDGGEGNQEAKQKFDQIAKNRQLFDKAKQQTEEIELLREQLSKLKAKTFANFSNAQR